MRIIERIRQRETGTNISDRPSRNAVLSPRASEPVTTVFGPGPDIAYLEEVIETARGQVYFDEEGRPYLPRNIRVPVIAAVTTQGGVRVLKDSGVSGLKETAMTVISAQDPRGEIYGQWYRHVRRQDD